LKPQAKINSVLLVEDNEITNFLSTDILLQMGVKCVDVVTNGERALDFLTRNCPDIILLDLNMPKMNGFEFMDAKRKRSLCPDSKVVILTSSVKEEDINKAGDYPEIAGFIEKPLTMENMKEILAKLF